MLAVRRGFNPNSSSLGFDASFLLFGVGLVSMVTAVISTAIRVRRAAPHGDPPDPE